MQLNIYLRTHFGKKDLGVYGDHDNSLALMPVCMSGT